MLGYMLKLLKILPLVIVGFFALYICLPYPYQVIIGQFPLTVGSDVEVDFGDVLIVPGSGCNPGCGTEERINLAASLYRTKRRKLIVSEGICSEQEVIGFKARLQHHWNINPNDIIWEQKSRSTKENVLNSISICDSLNLGAPIICTSEFHQLRCLVLMNKYWNGEFRIAQIKKEHLEYDHYAVYRNKRLKEIKEEYLKSVYLLLLH